ncbi:MAG: hypothetical protein HC844_06035 [Tabrizicola sp.]|nr:hypothetical protein [Tabrizicola sp.]
MTSPTRTAPDDWSAWIGPDETLLWHGQPEPDTRVRLGHIVLALFGAPFLVVGLYVLWGGIQSVVTLPVTLSRLAMGLFLLGFSVPFVGAGAAMTFGPHLAARYAHRRVRYAVTNRAVYVGTRWWKPVLSAYPVQPDAAVSYEADGKTGTVAVQVGYERDADGDKVTKKVKLEGIADAVDVYHLLRRIQGNDP